MVKYAPTLISVRAIAPRPPCPGNVAMSMTDASTKPSRDWNHNANDRRSEGSPYILFRRKVSRYPRSTLTL